MAKIRSMSTRAKYQVLNKGLETKQGEELLLIKITKTWILPSVQWIPVSHKNGTRLIRKMQLKKKVLLN